MEERIALIRQAMSIFDDSEFCVSMIGRSTPSEIDYDSLVVRYRVQYGDLLWFDVMEYGGTNSRWIVSINYRTLFIDWGTVGYDPSDWDIVIPSIGVSMKGILQKIKDNEYTLYDLIGS